MALSNWATMAFDKDGNHSDGTLTTYQGISAEIYKNWIYIRSKNMWMPGRFVEPTITQVSKGEITLIDLELLADQCELQQAVFVYASSTNYELKESRWMAGIGCYGYDNSEWVGVTPELADKFFDWLGTAIKEHWVSFGPEKSWIDACRTSRGRHFNQGDAYFEDKIGIEKPMLKPGEASEPFLSQIVKQMGSK